MIYNWMQKNNVIVEVSATYPREMEDKWAHYKALGYEFCPATGWDETTTEADIEDAFVSGGEAEYGSDVYNPTFAKYAKA